MPPYNLRGSWYSQLPAFGWFDAEDRPGSAALVGVPDWQQGIALPSRRTLGQWYNVTPPGGGIPYPMQQTDIGPAKWTGRGVDISAAAAHQMGYTPQSFPTNAEFKVEPRDEPRGLGSPAGLPVQAGDLPDNATGGDAYASGPAGSSTARKSMPSLMDMFSGGFNPVDAAGQPQSFDAALRGNSNSLIGLGMGLLQPRSMAVGAPAQSAWSNALAGYQQGAQTDAANAYRMAQLKHQQNQEAFQRSQAAQAQANFERTFARGDVTDFQKAAKDLGLVPGSPEYAEAAKKFYEPKVEGDWSVVQVPHPLYPGETVPAWGNKRTQEIRPFNAPGSGTISNAFANAQNPLAPGGQAVNGPAAGGPGVGGVSYGQALQGGQGFGSGNIAPAYPSGPASAAPVAADALPPAPPGSDPKEWRKEQTKLAVQKRQADEARAKGLGAIDPVTEDINRALNQTQRYPGMIAGMFGNLMKGVPGSQANDVAKLIDTIKATSTLDELKKLKAASPTGASGLGALSDKEAAILQNQIGALDQSQTPQQFLFNLERVMRTRHEFIHGPGTAPPPRFEVPEVQRPIEPSAGGGPRPGFVSKGHVFKGGDPSKQENWAPVR